MTELDEVAAAMLTAHLHWIQGTPRGNCMAAAREYVRQQMSDEGETLRDNVAYSLFRRAASKLNKPEMYVVKEGALYVMRQGRYAAQLAIGKEHPHDICAYARSVEEMHTMCDKHWPDADYTDVSADVRAEQEARTLEAKRIRIPK